MCPPCIQCGGYSSVSVGLQLDRDRRQSADGSIVKFKALGKECRWHILTVVSGKSDPEVPGHRCLLSPPSSSDSCSLQSRPGCPLCGYCRNGCEGSLLLRETSALTVCSPIQWCCISEAAVWQCDSDDAGGGRPESVVRAFHLPERRPSPSTPIFSNFSLRPKFNGDRQCLCVS